MRTVLLVAPHFPPLGGAAVQRNVQLARRLGRNGYRPVVVTRAGVRDDFRWTPRDSMLLDRELAEIHRLAENEPSLHTSRLRRWLYLVPEWQRWWETAAVGTAVHAGRDADIVHASVAPYLVGDAALAVARALRKPLVLDLEDPWALDEMLSYPTGLHRLLDRRQMRRILAKGDAVVVNAPEARLRVLDAFGELDPGRVFAIPNAFDPADFATPESEPRRDGRFRIVHTGSLHTDLGLRQRETGRIRRLLGGQATGVDYLTRSHVFLLEAVRAAFAARPEFEGVVEVHLAGMFTDDDRRIASRYPFVRMHEFLPHGETLALMRSADLLFLPLYDLPPGRRAGIVPHKTYEYVASGRPILAAVPDGDARDLLEQSGAALLSRPADVGRMTQHLLADVDRWATGAPTRSPRPDVVAWCSADRLVADLTSVYDLVLGDGARTEGSPGTEARHAGLRDETLAP